ncbi:MAG: ribulokinase [Anaerolineaceae bacterium]|nr:ribulokinase [Anaerolineaceae bacterium]
MSDLLAIGLDYGTESARALLVDVRTGEILSQAVQKYPDGVISEAIPGTDVHLGHNWALQNPEDWLTAAENTIREVMQESGASPEQVVGLGIDFTACTVLPTLIDGTPLCELDNLRDEPHAWPKLWKHHSAQAQADRITQLAAEEKQAWLLRYGGKVSSEWLLPKALEILEEKPGIYTQAAYIIEGADWVTWQFTGNLARNTCCAGYKGTWHKKEGFPSPAFLAQLNPDLADLFESKVAGPMFGPGQRVGFLNAAWAERLGLTQNCAVSAAIIDAHAAAIGSGLSGSGAMFLIMGTSTCHMLMDEKEVLVEGISGVVEDGIVPGLFGYEAGQVSVGDIFGWFVENAVPAGYQIEADQKGLSLHQLLTEKAEQLNVGESGLLSLDWWNGCRTPLVDADLTGLILGLNLKTRPEEIYRALIEGTAFGTYLIINLFEKAGVSISKLQAGGGLTQNDLILKIYADVTNLPIEVASSQYSSALGAAILGAVASGVYPSIDEAVEKMVLPSAKVVTPDPQNHALYRELFKVYQQLIECFGRDPESPMKLLLAIREKSNQI